MTASPHQGSRVQFQLNLKAVIAFSLHLSIAAVVQGVPVYRPATAPGEKYDLLEQFANVHTWDGTAEPLVFGDLGRHAPGAEVEAVEARLGQHWDAIASLVDAPRRPRSARLSALLAELTGLLETPSS